MKKITKLQQISNVNFTKFDKNNSNFHGISDSDLVFTKRYDLDPKAVINNFNIAFTGQLREQVERFVPDWEHDYKLSPAKSMDKAIEIGVNYCFDELKRGITPRQIFDMLYEY